MYRWARKPTGRECDGHTLCSRHEQCWSKTEADAAASLKPAGDVGRGRAQGRQRPLPQIIDGATDRGGRDADGADGMPIGIEDRHRENAQTTLSGLLGGFSSSEGSQGARSGRNFLHAVLLRFTMRGTAT